ncbi:MAG: hypothetical protein BAJATHORv1_60087 [Candidatus Thorarchaeota archaeon]|nr:MAG: hypothetical protein BAJATHORv1_60087 [Candidatus Thorarchaeota archaeon]
MNIEGAYISRIGILGSPSSASMINRIIINPIDETQYTITGRSDMTFRESCLYDWPFQNIRIDSKWYIFSENETDISNLPLSRYDGIAWIRTE